MSALKKVFLDQDQYLARDISWLHFNERVLQEAQDSSVPIIERIRFIGIYSNNMDEFFRVRYATIKRMSQLIKKSSRELGGLSPQKLLSILSDKVVELQAKAQQIYDQLILELEEKEGIYVVDETQLTESQKQFIHRYFVEKVSPSVFTIILDEERPFPELRDKSIYLSIELYNTKKDKSTNALIEIPSELIGRFIELPKHGKRYIMYLDDLIRYNLEYIFFIYKYDKISAHTVKFTRDAELDIEADVSKSFIDKMSESLSDRRTGDPVRFVYDSQIEEEQLNMILRRMDLDNFDSIIPGGRYHNKKDLMNFPTAGKQGLTYEALEPIRHPDLDLGKSQLSVIAQKDILLFLPYHTFSHIIRLLREAAIDEKVKSIKVTLYRLADNSRIISALINAAKNGKDVTVVMELQARFDEEANIRWTEKLKREGVRVIFGVAGLKVHSKVILIQRLEKGKIKNYISVGTGNFNEQTSRFYTDYHLFTSDKRIGKEIDNLFNFFEANYRVHRYKHLMISPHSTRPRLIELIEREIQHARQGLPSGIVMKINSLSDTGIIQKLYEASNAGVKIQLIVRGICSIICGVEGMSENIEAISIIDRFLEHSRIYCFHNAGKRRYFISSADIMARNLDYRVEVTVPIYCNDIKQQLQDHLDIIWSDNTKARIQSEDGKNRYREKGNTEDIRSQYALYDYVKRQSEVELRISN